MTWSNRLDIHACEAVVAVINGTHLEFTGYEFADYAVVIFVHRLKIILPAV